MTRHRHRPSRRRPACLLAGVALLLAGQGAIAGDDGGVHAFFSSAFGGATEPAPVASPTPPGPARLPRGSRERSAWRGKPLTVRPDRSPAASHNDVAAVPTKPGKVSILEDRTLRPGDAVMTAGGIKVFEGSRSFPYRPSDFIGVARARELSQATRKTLAELDKLPRS